MQEKIMKILKVWLVVILLAIAANCSAAGFEFKIAQSGKPLVAIVQDSGATLAEQNAAKELSSYLKQVTGANFPVYTQGDQPRGLARIYVGQSDETKKLLGNIDWDRLKFDGIIIKFVGKDLVLAGDRPRGTVYAVYTFLEDYVGCKWWTAKASKIPNKPNLSVATKNLTHISPYLYRETFYGPVIRKNMDFSVKLKLNGDHQPVPDPLGGHYKLLGFVHTADQLLPEGKYFAAHPEWFSLVNGKRIAGQVSGQLCLTNEEMKAELIKQALLWIDKDPSAGMIAIDQNDNYNFCQCDNCTAVANEEGGQAGLLIRFVNDVADAVNAKYPGFLVETLAYQYTRHAPKLVKPRDNVIVRLCSIECDFSKPLDSKTNESFYKDLKDWGKISKRLFIWDYVVNFGNLLVNHPNWRVIAPNIRIFANNSVVGLFEQGDGYNNDAVFSHMKIWVMSQLMWDPKLDQRKLMNEFADGYYGAAGKYLIKYLDLTSDAIDRSKGTLGCFIGSNMTYMTQNDMYAASSLFDKAEKVVKDNPTLLARVKLERQALDHMWILQVRYDRSKAGKSRGIDMNTLTENYISQAVLTGNNYIGEGYNMPDTYFDRLRSFAKVLPVLPAKGPAVPPAASEGLNKEEWADMQEEKMNLYQLDVLTKIVGDSAASDGRAARIPGSTLEWAAMAYLTPANNPIKGKVNIFASIKAKCKATTGNAFTVGLYDVENKAYIHSRTVTIEELQGKDGYIEYDLGAFTPTDKWYIYVAPPGNGDLVEGVYVDRFFVVKGK
jgi:hypothetical protein